MSLEQYEQPLLAVVDPFCKRMKIRLLNQSNRLILASGMQRIAIRIFFNEIYCLYLSLGKVITDSYPRNPFKALLPDYTDTKRIRVI